MENTQQNSTSSSGISYKFTDFISPEFSLSDRYNENAPYNEAPQYEWPKNIGLPIATNFSYPDVLQEDVLDRNINAPAATDAYEKALSVYTGLQEQSKPGSYQWDSFPAGEAQQFLITSVDNNRLAEIGPETKDGTTTLDVVTTSNLDRPYTLSLTVTPYNAGPIPHTHWAEDEWFIVLQGEMDAWLPLTQEKPYEVGEIPGQNGVPKIEEYHYVHFTPGEVGFLPAGYTHNYRNTSPTGEPLIFLTIWSRKDENHGGEARFAGGIEEFFIKPGIGTFFDTANEAAAFGSLYNKTPGSDDADRLQERFVKYFNEFPLDYVSMSQNFGSYLEKGGNWNPAIPKDTQPVPVPPPIGPYAAPTPNVASQTVNFNPPLDPPVIKRVNIPVAGANTQQILDLVNSYEASIQQQNDQGLIFADFYQDPNNPQNYLLIEQWQNYSQLVQYEELVGNQFINQLKALVGELSEPTIESIDTDSYANDQKVLIGKFQAKEGTREQIQDLASQLISQTQANESGKNLAFEFYEDPQQPNQYIFYEKYMDGAALTEHLEAQYTKDFFAGFAPLLTGNGLVDGDVNVYSIHTPGSPLSQVPQNQVKGVEILTNLFESTPELSVSLVAYQGIIGAVNETSTNDIGINLKFTAENSSNQPIEYGIFSVDDSNYRVDGLLPSDPGYLEAVKQRRIILFNTTNNPDANLPNPSRNIPVRSTHGYGLYQVVGGSIQDANPIVNFSFQDPQFMMQPITEGEEVSFQFGNGLGGTVALNGPVLNFQDTISQLQPQGFNLLDTSTIVNRQINVGIQIYKDSDVIHQIGFYPVENIEGTVIDPLTQQPVNPGDFNYANAALSPENKLEFSKGELMAGKVENQDNLILNSGKFYAPFVTTFTPDGLQPTGTYFAYEAANPDQSTRIISLGTNQFGIEDGLGSLADNDFNDVIFNLNLSFAGLSYPIV
jgi:quinol monooxygenase YgiN/oxalate decarboxylase/phosphoglucose isomerase-like protein (cupin superfamily)